MLEIEVTLPVPCNVRSQVTFQPTGRTFQPTEQNKDKQNPPFHATTSIKGHKQEEAIHLPKRFQWVNISVLIVNDSSQDQTV